MTEPSILFTEHHQVGLITLNRPEALNALTHQMSSQLIEQLTLWKTDERIQIVVIHSTHEKAFCAGGDIRALCVAGKEDPGEAFLFFYDEYRLNYLIKTYPKPYVALLDGITFGGGVGVSLHGSHPIASERFIFAMPETHIGYFPDIGSSYLFAPLKALGVYLGLTGHRLDAKAALACKLVHAVIHSDTIKPLLEQLMLTDFGANPTQALEACLTQFTTPTDAHGVALSHLAEIEACFKHPSLDAILKSLALNPSAWSREALETLSRCAPMSLQVTLARLLKAPGQTFAQTLEMDFILAYHFIHHTDFYEGVRARLLDKDKNPKWNPARVEDVADAMTQAYFVNPQEALSLHLT